jgi:hypothetical protein
MSRKGWGSEATLLALLGLAVIAGSRPAMGYIDIPPATLGRLCASSMNVTVLRVEKVDRDRGAVVYRAVRDLKGNSPADLIKQVIGRESDVGKQVLAWAAPGKTAVLFGSAARDYGYVYTDRCWYSATYAAKEGWWRLARAEPELLRAFCGSHEQITRAATDILAGKEVVVPSLAGASKEELRAGRGPTRSLRASLRLLDYNPGRDLAEAGKDARPPGPGR